MRENGGMVEYWNNGFKSMEHGARSKELREKKHYAPRSLLLLFHVRSIEHGARSKELRA
jgi:hypothetical protein